MKVTGTSKLLLTTKGEERSASTQSSKSKVGQPLPWRAWLVRAVQTAGLQKPRAEPL